jgi:hypothetical protein
VESKLRQSALQNRLSSAPDETRIRVLRAPQLLHSITSPARPIYRHKTAHLLDRYDYRWRTRLGASTVLQILQTQLQFQGLLNRTVQRRAWFANADPWASTGLVKPDCFWSRVLGSSQIACHGGRVGDASGEASSANRGI